MKNKKIASIVSVILGLAFVVAVSPAFANALTASTTRAQANSAVRLAKIIADSDAAITARITALNNLSARIQAIKNVSANEKTNISNEVQTNIAGLTSLKAKIDADTDATTAAADAKTITGSFRIYLLVIPQGYITASADRVDTIAGMMQTVSGKLEARITADGAAGKNVTALQASLADLNTKIADAQAQVGTDINAIASLVPDQGDKTKLAGNTSALKAARADVKTATADLKTARTDLKNIIQGLKSLGGNASAASPATTTAQ